MLQENYSNAAGCRFTTYNYLLFCVLYNVFLLQIGVAIES